VSGEVTSINFIEADWFIVSTGWLPSDISYSASTDTNSNAASEEFVVEKPKLGIYMIQNDEYILTNETFYTSWEILSTCLWDDAKKISIVSYEWESWET